MAINLRKEDFEEIDSYFLDITQKKNVDANLKKIANKLSKVFDKDFTVEIIKPERNDTFYVMSVFPEESTLDKLVASILEEKPENDLRIIWSENKAWHTEIDNRIITGSYVDASSKELTALLLHECGHVMNSNSIPHRMMKVIKYEYAKVDMGIKAVLKSGVFRNILKLPILKACMIDDFKTEGNMKDELKADFFVVKMGYGKELESLLRKMITYGDLNKTRYINQKSKDVYDKMKKDTVFSMSLVEALKERKNNVTKKNFEQMILATPSTMFKNTIGGIKSIIYNTDNGKTESTSEKLMMNVTNEIYEEAYLTEAFGFGRHKLPKIDLSIADYIALRVPTIQTADDKYMLISFLHSKIDTVEWYIKILSNEEAMRKYVVPHSMNQMTKLRADLMKVKDMVMTYKVPEMKYGIYVNYPNGYEG